MSGWTDLDDYRIARHAEELRWEARTKGYKAEDAAARDDHAKDHHEPGPPITYREWLKSRAGRKPSPEDEAALKAAEYERAVIAHMTAEEARDTYEKACAERALVFAELVAGGWSMGEIARKLGISRAAVHAVVKRARQHDGGQW